jgi:hypothetical protein
MVQTNVQSDPIVEILRLAYRRGLAIQQEQEEKRKAVSPQTLGVDIQIVEQEKAKELQAKEVRATLGN